MAEPPRVSVVVEGYNESLALGSVDDTLDSLRRQEFPLDSVELVLVGSSAQGERWRAGHGGDEAFAAVTVVEADGAHYFELKNRGIEAATAPVVALTDSDATAEPGWLAALVDAVEGGADVSVGPSLFRGERFGPAHPVMLAAASVSWGSVVGNEDGRPVAKGFQSHNVGFRRSLFEHHRYREDLGRTCAGWFLWKALRDEGARVVFTPAQRVAHTWSARWWGPRLHVRFGYEILQLRRLDRDWPRRWVRRAPPLEPLLTTAWHVALDVPQWLRFGQAVGVPPARRAALAPLVLGLSIAARGCELAGMAATLVAPDRMRRFAHSN